MITTKFKRFVEKLIEETTNGNIKWESAIKDDSSYKCILANDVKVQSSVINIGNTKEAILSITRNNIAVNVNLAPRGGEMNKLMISLFEIIYTKKLNAGIEMLEDNGEDKKKLDIMNVFKGSS